MAMSKETLERRKAAREYEKRMSKLISVADFVKIETNPVYGERLALEIDGCRIEGSIDRFNEMVERLGYRPVRITSNMLNAAAPRFTIDINTPSYCDPGCESYHTM